MENLNKNLLIAVNEIIEAKKNDPKIRCRLETCVNSDSVTVYVIERSKIVESIWIEQNGDITRKETRACQ